MTHIKWEDLNYAWDEIDLSWEEIVIEVSTRINKGGGYSEYFKNNPWQQKITQDLGKEKAEKFIKIMCNINGLDYEEIIKSNNNIKINVKHFEKTFKSVGVKVNLKK